VYLPSSVSTGSSKLRSFCKSYLEIKDQDEKSAQAFLVNQLINNVKRPKSEKLIEKYKTRDDEICLPLWVVDNSASPLFFSTRKPDISFIDYSSNTSTAFNIIAPLSLKPYKAPYTITSHIGELVSLMWDIFHVQRDRYESKSDRDSVILIPYFTMFEIYIGSGSMYVYV
jgi:hypothetical protein